MQTAINIATPTDRQIIRDYLLTVPSWRYATAREITAKTGLSSRTIRAVGQAYPTLFVTGQRGYKLAAYADRRELQEAVHHLLSRAQRLMERASYLSDFALRK